MNAGTISGQDLCEVEFGDLGNAEDYTLDGWSGPEKDLTWAVGAQSSIEFSNLPTGGSYFIVEFTLGPLLDPPTLLAQRMSLSANDAFLGEASVDGTATWICRIPGAVLGEDGKLILTFGHPDGRRPADFLPGNLDTRLLSLAFERIRLRVAGIAPRIPLPQIRFARAAAPVYPAAFDPALDYEAHARAVMEQSGLTCAELASRFESLGNNCELGFFQRQCGAEPLGLFRFANPEHDVILHEISTNFATYGDRVTVELDDQAPRREWIVMDRSRYIGEHTFIWEGDAPEDEVRRSCLTRLRFLRRMMIETMQDGSKIFVIKSGEHHLDRGIVTAIARALRQRGPNWLLWVVPGLQVGRVVVLGEGLLRGTIDRLAVQGDGTGPSLVGWLAVTTEAWRVVRSFQAGVGEA